MAELIAYFSRRDENYVSGALKQLEVGNTEVVAGIIKKLTGADMFQIEPKKAYSKDYNACIAEAQADQRSNARPELKAWPEDMEQYDTIYLAIRITGARCRWQSLHSWSTMILTGKRSVRSAHMRAADLEAA
mgnify:CR=1 FL=1